MRRKHINMNSNIRIIIGSMAVVGAIFGTVACEEKPAEVSKKADHSQVVVEEPTEPSEDVVVEEAPTEEVEEVEPAATTAVVGDTVEVGDWSVKVTEVALNANTAIHQANMYNDKPKGQFMLVSYEATYNGAERTADAESDLSWSITGSDNQVIDYASVVTPADDQEWPSEARKGGMVTGQVAFDINPAMLTGGILSVEGYTVDYDTVYADFAL